MIQLDKTYLDDVQGLVDRSLGIEREAGIDLGGDLAGDDVEDLTAELNQEMVESGVDLLVESVALLLAGLDGGLDQIGVLGLLGSGQEEGGVGGGILGLVLADGCGYVRWGVMNISMDTYWQSHLGMLAGLSSVKSRVNCGNVPESQTTTVPVALS